MVVITNKTNIQDTSFWVLCIFICHYSQYVRSTVCEIITTFLVSSLQVHRKQIRCSQVQVDPLSVSDNGFPQKTHIAVMYTKVTKSNLRCHMFLVYQPNASK